MAAAIKLMVSIALALSFAGLAHSFQFGLGPGLGHKSRVPALSMSAAAQTTKKSGTNPPQLVEFIEPETNVKVVLIGTMHYNPTSIKIVEETVEELGQRGALGSVVIESCDVRWNTTSELLSTRRGKFLKPVLTSEMKAAADRATEYGRPVVLGDQRINVTGTSLSNALKQTVVDLATPLNGGWTRFYNDVKEAADVALPSGPGYLTASSFFDPRLLIAAPVSFFKYPLSFLARNPISTMIVFLGLFALGTLDDGRTIFSPEVSLEEQIGSILASLSFAALEVALFGRVLVEVLLGERNEILARNILNQCKLYSKSSSDPGSPFLDFSSFFSGLTGNMNGGGDQSRISDNEIVYMPSSLPGRAKSVGVKDDEEKVVVAVLGMAHCNGIVKLLKEQLV